MIPLDHPLVMIEKKRRIKRVQIASSHKTRLLFRGDYLAVFSLNDSAIGSARITVSVSKKASKSAVVRNRIKRVVYEALRVRATELDCIAPFLLLFQCNKPYHAGAVALIRSDIDRFIGHAR